MIIPGIVASGFQQGGGLPTYRHYRFLVTSKENPFGHLRIYEVRYRSGYGGRNFAIGATVSGNISNDDEIVDNNLFTFGGGTSTGSTLDIDLGAGNEQALAQYTVTAGDGARWAPHAWQVLGSNDGISFTLIHSDGYLFGGDRETKVYDVIPLTPVPWSMSTFSYSGNTTSISNTTFAGIWFSSDGTSMYLLRQSVDIVYQYTLSTAWDITTRSVSDVANLSVGTQESSPWGLTFSDDGTKMYVVGSSSDTVFQYTLSTPWDLSTASYANKSVVVSTQGGPSPFEIRFGDSGSKMYVLDSTFGVIYQYTLSTPWDLSTASYANKSFTLQRPGPTSFFFKDDGTRLYVLNDTDNYIFEHIMSTAWDVSTAEYNNELYIGGQAARPAYGLFIKDSSALYVLTDLGQIYEYTAE